MDCRGSTLLLLLGLNNRHLFRAQARQLAQHPREPCQELCDQAGADDAAEHEGDAQDLLGSGLGLGFALTLTLTPTLTLTMGASIMKMSLL